VVRCKCSASFLPQLHGSPYAMHAYLVAYAAAAGLLYSVFELIVGSCCSITPIDSVITIFFCLDLLLVSLHLLYTMSANQGRVGIQKTALTDRRHLHCPGYGIMRQPKIESLEIWPVE
jgi:hypothetical protein